MPTQILVNVLRVPAGSAELAPGESFTINPGLFSDEKPVVPTLIQPDRGTAIAVDMDQPITATSVTFKNNGGVNASATFRFERGLSNELEAATLATSYWQGAAAGGGGSINAVVATAPINSSTPGGPTTTISLNDSGVVAGTYGDATGGDESLFPVITVTAKGLVSAASQDAIRIGGNTAKAYVDGAAGAAQANAEAFAEALAFGISSKEPAHVATTEPLPSYIATDQTLLASANGVFPDIDDQTIAVGERVLVKDETAQENNGIYELADAGSGASKWLLIRTADANTAQELCGSNVAVETGTDNGGTLWLFAANGNTFNLGSDPVIWTSLSMPNATTAVAGAVKLAGGLGGNSTTYLVPTLDMDHANKGTLAVAHGGTGLTAAGASGNVLTSNGTGWASSPLPAFLTEVSVAQTYFVTMDGGTAPTADGSLTKPFNNIQDAVDQAAADYTGGEPVQIIVAPGTYTGNVSITRKNLFFKGAGSRPEDTQSTQIIGTVDVDISTGVGSVYNDQISFDGFFISGVGAKGAAYIDGSSGFSITFANCYLTAGTVTSDYPTVYQRAEESRATFVGCTITDPTSNTSPSAAIITDSLLRMSDIQLIGRVAANGLILTTSAGVVFCDRVLADSNTTTDAISIASNSNPVSAGRQWAASMGAAFLTFVNSSLRAPTAARGISASVAAPTIPAGKVVTFFANNAFALNAAAPAVAAGLSYIAYNNTFLAGSNTTINGTQVASTEIHSAMRLSTLTASSPLFLDANKDVTTTGVVPAANGGTGQSSYAVGDLLYADTTTSLAKLADVATGNALISGGVGTAPSWGKVGLATHVSGTLPIANGGTNTTTAPTANGVVIGNTGGTAYTSTFAGSEGEVLVAGATGTAPSFGYALGKDGTTFLYRGIDRGSTVTSGATGAASIVVTTPVRYLSQNTAVVPGSGSSVPQLATTGILSGTRVTLVQTGTGSTTFYDVNTPGYSWTMIQLGGVPSRTLTQYQAIDFIFDGNYWIERAVGGSGVVQSVTAGTGITVTGATATPTVALTTPVAIANGGTGTASLVIGDANKVFASPNGAAGAPSFRSLVVADLPTSGIPFSSITGTPYDISGSVAGTPTASSKFFFFKAVRSCTIATTGHQAGCLTNPSATTTFTIYKGVTNVGTFAIDSSGVATFTVASAVSLVAGDVLTVEAPGTVNAIGDVYFTLFATCP